MTLRRKFVVYLLVLHAIFALALIVLLWNDRVWLIGVEIYLIASAFFAFRLFRGLFRPLDLLVAGADALNEKDFTTRLRSSGQPEMDSLITVYNRMMDTLREERITLQEQHYFLQKVMAASPSGILTLDFDGNISTVNPAAEQLVQLEASHLIGKPLSVITSPLGGSLSELEKGSSVVLPLRGIRRVKCTRSEFLDRGFPRTFYLLEELTEELRQSEKSAYEKLIRMMSHEVNNSIGAANSLLHSSLHYKDQLKAEDRDDFVTAIGVAISRTEHLNLFMKSFADIVRLPHPVKQPTDVRGLLDRICALMKAECEKRSIVLDRHFDAMNGSVAAIDAHQMEQVFVNVLQNAIDAVGSAGRIVVRLERGERGTIVTFEDSGPGINPDVRQMIFTPFFSTKENGQGIGLTLIQEILSQHGFEYSLESRPGEMTKFTVNLG